MCIHKNNDFCIINIDLFKREHFNNSNTYNEQHIEIGC